MPDLSTSISWSSFDPALAWLALLISVFGSWCGLSCAGRARRASGLRAGGWLVAAALALGGGAIWSMHFIGMVAYQGSVVYRLDVATTVLSLGAAVGASLVGLAVASRLDGWVGYVVGGLILGAGIGLMHYTAMSAMKMNATASYSASAVVISLAIAAAASVAALVLTLRFGRSWLTAVASLVMGVGVCAMFFAAMFGLTLTPRLGGVDLGLVNRGADPFALLMPIFAITAVLLFVLLFAGIFGARRDDPQPEATV